MLNPIKEVIDFNKKAGLLNNGYDPALEASFQIEEALEGFSQCKDIVIKADTALSPKNLSRVILSSFDTTTCSELDALDKACDSFVFAIGSMAKLGLNYAQITEALNIVCKANKAKLGMPKDEKGKLIKPDDFVGPEEKLQQLLEKR